VSIFLFKNGYVFLKKMKFYIFKIKPDAAVSTSYVGSKISVDRIQNCIFLAIFK